MDINTAFPSKFITAGDLPHPFQLSIQSVHLEELENRQGGKESKPVIYFVSAKKGLILNKTNADVIANEYGSETNTWLHCRIVLFATTTEAFGQVRPCVRVRIPPKQPEATPTTQEQPPAAAPAAQTFGQDGKPANVAAPPATGYDQQTRKATYDENQIPF